MHADGFLSLQRRAYHSTGVERGIQHRLGLMRLISGIGARLAGHGPKRASEAGSWRCAGFRNASVRCEAERRGQFTAIAAAGIVKTGGARPGRVAAPGPGVEIGFQRAGSEIGVEIPVSVPLPAWRFEFDADVGDGSERAPDMRVVFGECDLDRCDRRGRERDLAADTRDERKCPNLVDIYSETGCRPSEGTRGRR